MGEKMPGGSWKSTENRSRNPERHRNETERDHNATELQPPSPLEEGLRQFFTEVAMGDRPIDNVNWSKMAQWFTTAVGDTRRASALLGAMGIEMPRRPFNPH